jgi:hypothetical protein
VYYQELIQAIRIQIFNKYFNQLFKNIRKTNFYYYNLNTDHFINLINLKEIRKINLINYPFF